MKLLTKTRRILSIILVILLVVLSYNSLSVEAKSKKKKTSKKSTYWVKKKVTKYANDNVTVWEKPDTKSTRISTYIKNDPIKIIAISRTKKWYKVKYNGTIRYVKRSSCISSKPDTSYWSGPRLTAPMGVVLNNPSGCKESWYNLPMNGIVSMMRSMGFSESKYPYWIRDDGVKMLGRYVMCGANLNLHPRGSLVDTSLGKAIVCDTGGYAVRHPYSIDIATSW